MRYFLFSTLFLLIAFLAFAPASQAEGKLAVGSFHSCAVVAGGEVLCWGLGEGGQLGDGRMRSSASPVKVQGLKQIVEVAAAENWSCARNAAGQVWCWGATSAPFSDAGAKAKLKKWYEPGTPRRPELGAWAAATPVQLAGTAMKALSMNQFVAGGLDNQGQLWRWVNHIAPQPDTLFFKGNLPLLPIFLPFPLQELRLTGSRTLSTTGDLPHGCGSTATGQVLCWGGLPLQFKPVSAPCTRESIPAPGIDFGWAGRSYTLKPGPKAERLLQLTAAQQQNCRAQRIEGESLVEDPQQPDLICCQVSSQHQSETGSSTVEEPICAQIQKQRIETETCPPRQTEAIATLWPQIRETTQLARSPSGVGGMYALTRNGNVWFWGFTLKKEFALPSLARFQSSGSWSPILEPVKVPELQGATQLKQHYFSGCFTRNDRRLHCWGNGYGVGLLGTGVAQQNSQKPLPVKNLGPVAELGLGHSHTCALETNGTVKCWGNNHYSVLGPVARGKGHSALPLLVTGVKVPL